MSSPESITAIGGIIIALTGLVTAVSVLLGRLRKSTKLNTVLVDKLGNVIESASEIEAADMKADISTTASIADVGDILDMLVQARKNGKI